MRDQRSQRWRGILKETLAAGIWRAHDRLATPRARALVIGYHRVVEDFDAVARTDMPTLLISRLMFERHLETIGHYFRFVTLDEIGRHVESGEPFRSSVAAVTFDDGYQDVYEHAFPILRRKGIPGAVFVVTNHWRAVLADARPAVRPDGESISDVGEPETRLDVSAEGRRHL